MSGKNKKALLGICGVYCGACSTCHVYNDNDQVLIEWKIKMGMPADEIYYEGCGSKLVNKWCIKLP